MRLYLWTPFRYVCRSPNVVKIKSNLVRDGCRSLAIIVFSLGWLMGTAPGFGQMATFSNPTPISIPASPTAGVSPYPSIISVSGLAGLITNVTVTLTNLYHTNPDDLDILLVGPGGQTVLLMSDAGGTNDLDYVTLKFSDASKPLLPTSGQITNGTYRPSNYGSGDGFAAPAPAEPYGTDLAAFNETSPNGSWRLFVSDDMTAHGGSVSGGWSLEFEVNNRPPVITSQPQSQTVAPGSDVTFNVTAVGTPPLGYQWLRNGQVLVPFSEGTASLKVSNAQAADAGTYAVVVTNSANRFPGVISSNATLNVLGPLTVVESPRTTTAKPGETITLRITAAGDPPLYYQWRLNGALLPGQTNATLTLGDVQATSGGAFSVAVYNQNDAVVTAPALLLVRASTDPEPADDFRGRPASQGASGVLQGNSSRATVESGEPVTTGGGRSVWFEWVPPDDGIATLMARGSAFDTLLSVFTGNTLSNLTLVTKDDDRGGFYTSSLQFNARRGTSYQIQLDGFGLTGDGGEFTLSWVLSATSEFVPVILENPKAQAVLEGAPAIFSVLTASPLDTYQWFLNGAPIRGATGDVYHVLSAQPADVGIYSVVVANRFGRTKESPPAALQIGSEEGPLLQLKSQLLAFPPANGNRPGAGFVSIGLGDTVWKQGAVPPPGPASPCNTFWGTLTQGLHADDNGVIMVDTLDSDIPARLAVYAGFHDVGDVPIACDIVSGPAGQPCVVKFNAVNGADYTVEIEGYQVQGTIKLTCKMGVAPILFPVAKHCLVPLDGSFLLQMPATNWCPLPACQWRFNGHNIAGATDSTLLLTNFNLMQAGVYSVVMSNFVRVITNTVAHLDLAPPFLLSYALATNSGNLRFVITSSNAAPYVLQTTTNLTPVAVWTPLVTNTNPCVPLLLTNSIPLLDRQRFFRAVPWPPSAP